MSKKSIGGLWKRDGQYGPYMSGQIEINGEKINFRVYENTYKKAGDKTPDFKIFAIEPRPQKAGIKGGMTEEDVPF